MLFLALRHLVARKRQTLLTLLGIVFGAMAYVVISGFMVGFQEFLIDQLLNNDAHIRVWAREELLRPHSLDREFFGDGVQVFWTSPPGGRKDDVRIEDPQGWYRMLEADPRVVAYSPQLTAQVIVTRAKASTAARMIGSIPARQVKVTNLAAYMVEGQFTDLAAGGNRILLGVDLMTQIGARNGDTVLVSNGRERPVPFRVTGSFRTGIKTVDEGTVFASLADTQRINATPSQVNELAIRVRDVDQAAAMAADWRRVSQEKVQSWDQINANFLNVFRIQNVVRYMTITVVLIVAGFGIYNILNMVVTQKRKEIAILRSMGFTPLDVMLLFLVQGLVLGLAGAVIGEVAGFGVCRYLETLPFGNTPLGNIGSHITMSYQPGIYIRAFFLSVTCAAIAALLPARAAGRLSPIDIIRAGAE